MNADQLIEELGAAAAAAKPAQEYCFLWIDWWPMCMTKAEWSGWIQAVFSVVAILASSLLAIYLFHREKSHQRALHLQSAVMLAENLLSACNGALNCSNLESKADLTSLFEDAVDQASVLVHVDLPIDGRVAINGLRGISRLAFNYSKVSSHEQADWPNSFRHWSNRVSTHLECLKRLLPKAHVH